MKAKDLKPGDIILHGGEEIKVLEAPIDDPKNDGKLSVKTDSWGMFNDVPPDYNFETK